MRTVIGLLAFAAVTNAFVSLPLSSRRSCSLQSIQMAAVDRRSALKLGVSFAAATVSPPSCCTRESVPLHIYVALRAGGSVASGLCGCL